MLGYLAEGVMMNIYLACGLTHVPRSVFPNYVAYIHALAQALREVRDGCNVRYALVNSDPQLSEKPWESRASLCYAWDRRMVEEAGIVVADASFPSMGLGIELQIAESRGIPIILLIGDYGINRVKTAHYVNPDATEHDLQIGEGIVSLMALGLPSISQKISYQESFTAIDACVRAVDMLHP